MNNNIILTGPPRSGTTLACFLLNKVVDTVALHEPMSLQMFPDKESGIFATREFFQEMRLSLVKNKTAISKISEGSIPSNPFSNSGIGKRDSIVKKGSVYFDKPLSGNFNLIIKHNAHFTFLLPELQDYFPVYILIRNPVSTIASWNSVNAPVASGNLRILKTLNPELFHYLESIPDLITRQVILLDRMYQFYSTAKKVTYLKYEEMIVSGGGSLNCIIKPAADLNESLENKNSNPLYDPALIRKIKSQLLSFAGSYLEFYSVEDIEKF